MNSRNTEKVFQYEYVLAQRALEPYQTQLSWPAMFTTLSASLPVSPPAKSLLAHSHLASCSPLPEPQRSPSDPSEKRCLLKLMNSDRKV